MFEFQEWELEISGLRIFYWNHAPLVKCSFSLELLDQEEPFLTFFFRPTAKKSPVKYTSPVKVWHKLPTKQFSNICRQIYLPRHLCLKRVTNVPLRSLLYCTTVVHCTAVVRLGSFDAHQIFCSKSWFNR